MAVSANDKVSRSIDSAGKDHLIVGIGKRRVRNVGRAGHNDGFQSQKRYQLINIPVCDVIFVANTRIVKRGNDFSENRWRDDKRKAMGAPGSQRLSRQTIANKQATDIQIGIEDNAKHDAKWG